MTLYIYCNCDNSVLQISIVPEDWPELAMKQAVVL